jgi:hypothetical protein
MWKSCSREDADDDHQRRHRFRNLRRITWPSERFRLSAAWCFGELPAGQQTGDEPGGDRTSAAHRVGENLVASEFRHPAMRFILDPAKRSVVRLRALCAHESRHLRRSGERQELRSSPRSEFSLSASAGSADACRDAVRKIRLENASVGLPQRASRTAKPESVMTTAPAEFARGAAPLSTTYGGGGSVDYHPKYLLQQPLHGQSRCCQRA